MYSALCVISLTVHQCANFDPCKLQSAPARCGAVVLSNPCTEVHSRTSLPVWLSGARFQIPVRPSLPRCECLLALWGCSHVLGRTDTWRVRGVGKAGIRSQQTCSPKGSIQQEHFRGTFSSGEDHLGSRGGTLPNHDRMASFGVTRGMATLCLRCKYLFQKCSVCKICPCSACWVSVAGCCH